MGTDGMDDTPAPADAPRAGGGGESSREGSGPSRGQTPPAAPPRADAPTPPQEGSGPARGLTPQGPPTPPPETPAPRTPEALIAAWQRGDWSALDDAEAIDLPQHPRRAVLSLVRASARLERFDLEAAEADLAQAAQWGVREGALVDLVLASAQRDLSQARMLQGRPAHARRHLASAADLVKHASSGKLATAAATSAIDPVAEAARLRDEVLNLRKLVNALRGAARDSGGADAALIQEILAAHLTYLSVAKMRQLADTARAIEAQRIPGVFIEAGCALGGSAILLARTKRPERVLRVHDVFGMIPPPSDRDPPHVHERYRTIVEGQAQGLAPGERYYGYEVDLLSVVQHHLERFGVADPSQHVTLIQGLVQDTMVDDGPVALAHIDVDWHDPVKFCLDHLFPRLSVGGSIVVDDYHDWDGCRQAVDDFLAVHGAVIDTDDSARSMKLTRIAPGDGR